MAVKADITIDIDKQVGNLQNLTNIYNARVGDNNTPLTVLWQKNGIALNLKGLHAFIAGKVGDGSYNSETDKVDFPVGTPVVKYEDDGSGTLDNGQSGLTTLLIPKQMWQKSGIFAGYIGLKDENGSVFTSKDIFFKVLGNVLDAGVAINYFIDDFSKVIQNSKLKLQENIDDARNAYESETKNAHDSLEALKAQIQANRDEQETLSQHLAGTKQQIEIHDVVTRPEFFNLSNQLTQQVGQMKEAGLEFFNNADDLKAKYPNGANKLCVTLNDSHEWLYDYANNQWNDAGAFNYGTIDPKLEAEFLSKDSDNLISNSDFATLDGIKIYNSNGSKANVQLMPGEDGKSNVLRLIGYWDNGADGDNWVWTELPHFSVQGLSQISYSAKYVFNSLMANTGGAAVCQLAFYRSNGARLTQNETYFASNTDDNFKKLSIESYKVPSDATEANLIFGILGTGVLEIKEPQANRNLLKPYSANRAIKDIASQSENLLIDQPIWTWSNTDPTSYLDNSTLYKGCPTYHISSKEQAWHPIDSNLICVQGGKRLRIIIPATISATGNDSQLIVSSKEYDKDNDLIQNTNYTLIESKSIVDHILYFDLTQNTVKLRLEISAIGNVEANVGSCWLNYDSFSIKNTIQPSEFFNVPDGYESNHSADLDEKHLNIIGNSQTWCAFISAQLKLPQDTNWASFEFDSKLENADMSNYAVVVLRQYDENNEIIGSTGLPVSKNNQTNFCTNKFVNIPILKNTNYITLVASTFGNAKLSLGNINIKLDTDSILLSEALKKTNDQVIDLVPHVPAINWPYQDGESVDCATIDFKNLYNGQPTAKLYTHDLDLTNWHGLGELIDLHQFPVSEINIQAIYSSNCDDKTGKAQINVNMYTQDGNHAFSYNYDLKKSAVFIKQQFNHISVPANIVNIRIACTINGSGTANIAELRITDKPITEKNTDSITVLPQFKIEADSNTISSNWTTAEFNYQDKDREIDGYIQYAIQGNSSSGYEKKNLKIKLFKDENCKAKLKIKPKADWTANNKYNLKANWIDATQSRNLVNAQMIKKAYQITPIANSYVSKALTKTQSLGQMEGFPIELSFKNGYYGLMTFNTKKDDKTFGMDSNNPDHECVTNQNSENGFKTGQGFNSATDYWTEIHDVPSETLKANMTSLINFINTASDDDFKAKISNYIDVYSVINTYLYGLLSEEWDFQNKSQLLLTWNSGKYFFMIPYDLDSTWGLYWMGTHIDTDSESAYFDFKENSRYASMNDINNLMARIIKLFKPEIKAQWNKLRNSVWRNDQITGAFKKYINSIPEKAYEREQERWANIPSKDITDFAQIQQSIITRGNAMDNFMEHFADSQPTSGTTPATPQPTTPQAQPTESKQ